MLAENSNMPEEKQPSKSINSIGKTMLTTLVQHLMDIEVSQILSASRYERSDSRRAYRNGYRKTVWNTSLGNIELQIPKLRQGTYYPEKLLNDATVQESLVQLVEHCLVYGLKSNHVAESIRRLNLVKLSNYELHRIYDALHLLMDATKSRRRYIAEEPRLHVMNRQSDESTKEEQEFWKDFSRRMAHAGIEVEESILSGVNPYARIDSEPPAIIRPDFARQDELKYIHDNLRIA